MSALIRWGHVSLLIKKKKLKDKKKKKKIQKNFLKKKIGKRKMVVANWAATPNVTFPNVYSL
jgi:hypothetical protein